MRQRQESSKPALSRNDQIVVVGRFGAPFGIKGWIKVSSFTDPPENILTYKPWMIQREGAHTELAINQHKPGKMGFIVQVNEIDDRDQVRQFTGSEIIVPASSLPEPAPNEYYWSDLIGMEVITLEDFVLGKVTTLIDTGSNSVLVIRRVSQKNKKTSEHLVPWLPAQGVIKGVSLAERQITVDWDPNF